MPDTVITLPEQPGSVGTPDLVIIFDDGLYAVIELKYEKLIEHGPEIAKAAGTKTREISKSSKPNDGMAADLQAKLAKEALSAIAKKKYLRPYWAKAKRIVKIDLGIYGRGQCLALAENAKTARPPAK
jgi:hypothetical protein